MRAVYLKMRDANSEIYAHLRKLLKYLLPKGASAHAAFKETVYRQEARLDSRSRPILPLLHE